MMYQVMYQACRRCGPGQIATRAQPGTCYDLSRATHASNRTAVLPFAGALTLGALLMACAAETPHRCGTPETRCSSTTLASAGNAATAIAGNESSAGSPGIGETSNPIPLPLGGSPSPIVDAGPPADAMAGCVGTKMSAPPPNNPRVDIVWVVDASASMLDEQMKIGANLSQFADKITQSNIDVRIVMLTASAAIPVICPVTSPDPLAGTQLANDARYRFIESPVDSQNALDIAVNNYPMYRDFLRPDAATHFVIVSDDESRYKLQATADARAQMFHDDMKQLLGKDFTQHTISSEGPLPCNDPNCMPDVDSGICVFVMLGCGAAAPGDTYYALANMTQGLTESICQSDWGAIFDKLSTKVVESAPLPCNYEIPPPPKGDALDPSKVNVAWTPANSASETLFPKSSDASACADNAAWYYDAPDAPKQVLLCPAACQQISGGGTLNIAFGCATVMVL